MVWAPRLHGEPGGPTSITGTARFMPATFYIASLPFQDALQIGGSCSQLVADCDGLAAVVTGWLQASPPGGRGRQRGL